MSWNSKEETETICTVQQWRWYFDHPVLFRWSVNKNKMWRASGTYCG